MWRLGLFVVVALVANYATVNTLLPHDEAPREISSQPAFLDELRVAT